MRDLDPDYGIDMLVDIYEDDEATGHSFYIQMKSTRQANLRRALAVRLTAEQAALYRSVDLPVLIAVYAASVDRVFVRWFHTYDPHYEARASQEVRKTFTFRLTEHHEWVDLTPEDLSRVTEAFRLFRSPQLPLPLRFFLTQPPERVHGRTMADHLNSIRRVAEDLRDVVVLQAGAPPAGEPGVVVEPTAVVASLGGLASTTGHYDSNVPSDRWSESLPYDVLTLIALTLDQIGHTALAARIAAQGARESKLVADPDVAWRLTGAFARAHRFGEAIEVAEALDESDDPDLWLPGDMILSACRAYDMPMREREAYIAALNRRIERRLDRGEVGAAAASAYTLGNFLFTSMFDPRSAFAYYRRAAAIDPTYRQRGYFYRDIGGIMFELGRPALAAEAYGRALDLGDRPIIRARHADALLFAGRLREAEEAFEQYLDADPDAPPEWRLKRLVLPTLRETAGDSVRRRPDEAMEIFESIDFEAPLDTEAIADLQAARDADVLCGVAWFNLGLHLASNDVDSAFLYCLMGALTDLKADARAWAATAALAWGSTTYRRLVDDVLWAGVHYVGHELADFFGERPEDWPPDDWVEFEAAVERAVAAEEARVLAEQGFEMRFATSEQREPLTLDIRRGRDPRG